MGFSTWRFWIKLVVLMGFIGMSSVAVYEVQAATSIGEVIVIDDRPKPANPINAPGNDILTPKPLKNNLPRPPKSTPRRLPQTGEHSQQGMLPVIGTMLLLINSMGLSFWRRQKDKEDDNEKANP